MRRTPVALIPLVVSMLIAACGGDQGTTGPRGIVPTGTPSADFIPACNFTTMNQDAKNYFPSKDTVFTMIAAMKTAYKTSVVAATPSGFDILTRVATVRDGGLQIGLPTAGGKFVDDVVGCMDVGPLTKPDSDKFQAASALGSGIFEVRGLPALAPAVTAGAGTPASPLWGAEPANGSWTRSNAPYIRYLVYGYPLGTNVRTAGFALGTLPDTLSHFLASSSDAFRVGLCISPAQSGTANRLEHTNAIVTDTNTAFQGTLFCNTHVVSLGSGTWFASLVQKAASLLAPRSLSAQDGGGLYGIGGLPDGWSPFNPTSITGSSVALSFGPLPVNVSDSTQFTLVVHAGSSSVAKIPGVTVTLTIANNSGAPAQAVLIPSSPFAVTDKDGNATFTIAIGKPGGYTLTASGTLSGVNTQSVISAVFNIKN